MVDDFKSIFQSLKNKSYIGAVIGEVIETFPNLRVAISDTEIIEKDDIIVSSHIMKKYSRTFEISEGKITLTADSELALAQVTGQATESPTGHKHQIKLNDNKFTGTGTIKWTDTLLKGDMVLMIATMDNQTFFLLDKGEAL